MTQASGAPLSGESTPAKPIYGGLYLPVIL